jgi:hypothetical protein
MNFNFFLGLSKNKKLTLKKLTSMSEDQIQQQIFTFYNNNYCLKNHNPRHIIFSVPNGGSRNIVEAKKMKATGILAGVSDLIIVNEYKTMFIEVKVLKGVQSDVQKEFENRVTSLGFEYILVRSLEDFKNKVCQL